MDVTSEAKGPLTAFVRSLACTVVLVCLLVTTANVASMRGRTDGLFPPTLQARKAMTTLTLYHYVDGNLVLVATFTQNPGETLEQFTVRVNREWAQLLRDMGY